MAAGKSRDGVDGSFSAASWSGARVISSEARLDCSCSMVRAPMSVEVTAGRGIPSICVHYEETLRVDELAALAAMSVSSFHRHFRAVTSMTPIQFQKQIRLQEGRSRVLADADDDGER